MDPLCHTLTGAALGEAGLKRRTALGLTTLMLAANLPDIDVAVFATDTLAVSFRRGWTHGVLALAVLPAVLAGLMAALDRLWRRRRSPDAPPADVRALVLLAYVGTLTHPFLDFLNSYGIRLLMPFSGRWFYGDALYIVDPWMYVLLGGGVWLARWRARRGFARPWQPARLGLALTAIYIAAMLGSNAWARHTVHEGLARAGQGNARFMVTPVFADPFRREVIVDTGERYEKGLLWFEPAPHFRPSGYGVETNLASPMAARAEQVPAVRAFLGWSRFPFFVAEPTAAGPRVRLNDYRYSDATGETGWAGLTLEPSALPPASGGEP
ncbi:MAG: metal-dependent hydrolase [Vicinamibacterales bacterium]